MNQDFLKDEAEGKPYESIKDWHRDIKHLIIPTILMVFVGIALYLYFRFFYL